MKNINEIFKLTDKFELCNGVFCCFAELDNSLHADQYEETERIITLVWHASGIIENGGFHYLLEGDFEGDPGFILTAEAFKAIGAQAAYQAFKEVMTHFKSGLPQDTKKRLKIYEAIPEEESNRIDSLFWSSLDTITTLLAEYIRSQEDDVRRIIAART